MTRPQPAPHIDEIIVTEDDDLQILALIDADVVSARESERARKAIERALENEGFDVKSIGVRTPVGE